VRSRLVVVSVYGVVTAALVAGTTAFVSLDKNVSISVDGQVTHVRTYASSVQAVLNRAGVVVGPHDSLTPAPTKRVHNGTYITIARGREVTFTIDGVNHLVWVTADNVNAVLNQAGLRIPDAAVLSVDRSARVPLSGMSINIDMPHVVNVRVDGSLRSIVSTKTTLAGVLEDGSITLNPQDQISNDLNIRPYDGLLVTIVRISGSVANESVPVPFTSTTKTDATLLVGTKKVVQNGANGTLVRTYQLSFADGAQTSKILTGEQLTVPPVQQITALGTKPKPIPKPKPVFKVAADGLNWAALARCESGGRANADNPPFYGMYQFRLATWRAVGGSGLPSQASASEQTYRAQVLYKRSNWRTQWPVCGHNLFS
jgi:resuscitation-promoting factor RpfB